MLRRRSAWRRARVTGCRSARPATSGCALRHQLRDGRGLDPRPEIQPAGTVVAMNYGGATPVPAAQSHDDTFDRVPAAANLIARGPSTRAPAPASALSAARRRLRRAASTTATLRLRFRWRCAAALSLEPRGAAPMLAPDNAAARFARAVSLNFERSDTIPTRGSPPSPASTARQLAQRLQPPSAPPTTSSPSAWVYTRRRANEFETTSRRSSVTACSAHPRLPSRARSSTASRIFQTLGALLPARTTRTTPSSRATPASSPASTSTSTPTSPRSALHPRGLHPPLAPAAMTVDTTTRPHATRSLLRR